MAPAVSGDDSYVRRPQGWFILVPPLTKPDPVTGAQSIDDSAPQKHWSAMVIRGRDGHDYDFAEQYLCQTWINVTGLKLYEQSYSFPLHWLSKSRCARDDTGHSVMTNDHWSETMQRYIH